MNLTGPVVTCRYGHSVVGRIDQSRELSPSERAVPEDRQDGPMRVPATVDLAETALRAGLALAVVMAATDCVFALVAGAGALAAIQGVVLVAVGLAGVVRIDVAARLLRPKGRVVLLAGLFAAGGVLDAGLYEHFGGVAGALVCIAALVCAARWVALCLAVCTAGYLGGLALHGSSLAWMLGDGRYAIAGHLVNFAGNGGVGLLMVAFLRRFLAGAPLRLAAVRAGGRSLTPQLALTASGRYVALLPAADARTLIVALTHAERQVVALLATGRVPKQAARDLTIALATVRSRIASAKRKTGARTLDQLVAMYAEAELVA
jgi:DNA-binding CsgD family transcriptional regulator